MKFEVNGKEVTTIRGKIACILIAMVLLTIAVLLFTGVLAVSVVTISGIMLLVFIAAAILFPFSKIRSNP